MVGESAARPPLTQYAGITVTSPRRKATRAAFTHRLPSFGHRRVTGVVKVNHALPLLVNCLLPQHNINTKMTRHITSAVFKHCCYHITSRIIMAAAIVGWRGEQATLSSIMTRCRVEYGASGHVCIMVTNMFTNATLLYQRLSKWHNNGGYCCGDTVANNGEETLIATVDY